MQYRNLAEILPRHAKERGSQVAVRYSAMGVPGSDMDRVSRTGVCLRRGSWMPASSPAIAWGSWGRTGSNGWRRTWPFSLPGP